MEAAELRYTRKDCVHTYYLSWAGKCEGCRKIPLSSTLPDPQNPLRRVTISSDAPEEDSEG
jgi:hypothetical protein